MNLRFFVVLLTFLSFFTPSFTQNDSLAYTTFSKGRSLVALNGAISSSKTSRYSSISNNNPTINHYSWDIRLAKLVARNFALGLTFDIERQSSENIVILNSEVLALGPWMAYYLTKGQPGGLYLQTSFYFVNYNEDFSFSFSNPPIDETTKGMGIGGSIGFGYNYVVFDRIGLELSMNYRQGWIWGEFHDKIQRTKKHDSFNRVDVVFKFGFIILFDRIKKDE